MAVFADISGGGAGAAEVVAEAHLVPAEWPQPNRVGQHDQPAWLGHPQHLGAKLPGARHVFGDIGGQADVYRVVGERQCHA
ncbi:Uncharacterised protein [Mycobacterium tuberculosis]|uniref:Uncharacterized protein n=1 Tax=Mycobacterium tuberculosis TaxID=1773 RepID=A0A655AR40_MYCTX|nr:Uncharacterised protein [Mycobacterium tuberculosis]CKS55144.1 Uncharacterised protein [Mycobacterium tuberculosis]CKU22026.1 Uncharacterised protein [Mycobacterium tuberculosis]